MKKWEAVGETLPHVVDRMMSLKELHQQGTCCCVCGVCMFAHAC